MASSAAYQIGQTWREAQDTNALVRRAQSGDADAIETLLRRSAPILGRAMRSLHLPGEEPADTLAFHRRSFLIALRDYRPERGASWPRFLHMVLCRRLDADITASRRKKRWRGQRDLPLDEIGEREIPDPNAPDPARMADVIDADTLALWLGSRLSGLEEAVARGIAEGLSYAAIAQQLGVRQKTVDNALQRLRRKALRNREREVM